MSSVLTVTVGRGGLYLCGEKKMILTFSNNPAPHLLRLSPFDIHLITNRLKDLATKHLSAFCHIGDYVYF